ncbi:MAG: hypothetical protein RIE73_31110 [Coleofasciculus sp. C1-SOL-03]
MTRLYVRRTKLELMVEIGTKRETRCGYPLEHIKLKNVYVS